MSGRRLEIVVQNASRSSPVPRPERIRDWVRRALGERRSGEVTVRIVGESESAALNERFRRGAGATNVLAFPYDGAAPQPSSEPRSLGDLVICAPVLEREAAAQGKPVEAHWAHIAIHGALHLIGYDHETEADARVMEARERALLAALGFDDPYGAED